MLIDNWVHSTNNVSVLLFSPKYFLLCCYLHVCGFPYKNTPLWHKFFFCLPSSLGLKTRYNFPLSIPIMGPILYASTSLPRRQHVGFLSPQCTPAAWHVPVATHINSQKYLPRWYSTENIQFRVTVLAQILALWPWPSSLASLNPFLPLKKKKCMWWYEETIIAW